MITLRPCTQSSIIIPHLSPRPPPVIATQATYQSGYLEGVGGCDGFVAAFYACAALMYRMTSIPMAAGCQPVVHLGGVMVALLGNTNAT